MRLYYYYIYVVLLPVTTALSQSVSNSKNDARNVCLAVHTESSSPSKKGGRRNHRYHKRTKSGRRQSTQTPKQSLKSHPKNNSKNNYKSKAALSTETQLDYSRNGHAVLRSFLDRSMLRDMKQALIQHSSDEDRILAAYKQKIEVAMNANNIDAEAAVDCRTIAQCKDKLRNMGIPTDDLPFLQHFNCWRHIPLVREFCTSSKMSYAAAQLLDVDRVRLYQDSLFHKRRDDGPTPWHSDARMAPFDTSNMITFWIPLQDIPADGTGLVFVSKSHSDFALPYWNDVVDGADGAEFQRLDERYSGGGGGGNRVAVCDYMPLTLGDVTVHAGWTLHCADGNGNGGSVD